MTVTLDLDPSLGRRFQDQAEREGLALGEYIARLLEKIGPSAFEGANADRRRDAAARVRAFREKTAAASRNFDEDEVAMEIAAARAEIDG